MGDFMEHLGEHHQVISTITVDKQFGTESATCDMSVLVAEIIDEVYL
jgi:hypothetical protein